MFYDRKGNVIAADINAEDIPIIVGDCPTVYVESETAFTSLTKETKSYGTLTFVDGKKKIKKCPVTIKLQGNTASTLYDKKSLNVTFYTDDTYEDKQKFRFNHWYPTNKIHIKGNPSDASHVRNSVCAKIVDLLMGKTFPEGAMGNIDSFPCILYYNGEWMGCYTFNLSQDDNTFNMDKDSATNVAWRCKTSSPGLYTTIDNWEIRSENEDVDGVTDSFAALLPVMADAENLTKDILTAHFDIHTLTAYMLICQIGGLNDNLVNNWTIATWDGVKWYHILYDMDYGFGIRFGGGAAGTSGSVLSRDNTSHCCAFFMKCAELLADEMVTMYAWMRGHGADAKTLSKMFIDFKNRYGQLNWTKDEEKWAGTSNYPVYSEATDIYGLEAWLTERFACLDELYGYGTTTE